MSCDGCKERGEMLVKAREAYKQGDVPEVKRLLKAMFGTALRDLENMASFTFKLPEGDVRFDLTSDKPKMPKPSPDLLPGRTSQQPIRTTITESLNATAEVKLPSS